MSAASVLLIGPQERLELLKIRVAAAGEVLSLSEADVARALEVLATHVPQQVVLERFFAATPRGLALIARLRADPLLSALVIRVMAHDSDYERTIEHRVGADTPTLPSVRGVNAVALDEVGTRGASRTPPPEAVDVLVDGKPVSLVDLSEGGAQVTSPAVLRPNQRVRVAITWEQETARVGATVKWANFEMDKDTGKPRYRAGLDFNPGEADLIEALVDKWQD